MGSLSKLFERIELGERAPSEEEALKGSLSELFDNHLADNIRSRQNTYIEDNFPAIDPEDDCTPLGDSGAMSPDMKSLLDRIGSVEGVFSDIFDIAEENAILLCDVNSEAAGFRGGYSDDLGIIGVDPTLPTAMRTAAEEFVHSYQDHPRLNMNEYRLADFNLWKFGIEAQAKLSVAVEAVRQKHDQGNDEFLRGHQTGVHFEIAKYLDGLVEEAGGDTSVLSDPDVLSGGFEMIMGHNKFSSSYLALSVRGGEGSQSISAEDFARQFGTVIGDDPRNNFLEGRITEVSDIVEMLPRNTSQFIERQIEAAVTSHDKAPSVLEHNR